MRISGAKISAPPTTAEPPLELPKAVAEAPPDSTLPVAPQPLAIVAPPSTLPSLEKHKTMVEDLLARGVEEVRLLSRDEEKQDALRNLTCSPEYTHS